MIKTFFALLTIYMCLFCKLECAKILCYFNIGLYSRHTMYQALTKELADRGHEVVVITPLPRDPGQLIPNLTEVNVSVMINDSRPSAYSRLELSDTSNPVRKLELAMQSATVELEHQLQTEAFQKLIKERKKYDLLLIEPMAGAAGLVLSHIFKVPVILVRTNAPSLREFEMAGFEMRSQFMYVKRTKLSNLALWDAAISSYNQYQIRQSCINIEVTVNEVLKRNIGANIPPLQELWKNVQAVLINVHSLWDNNVPVPPNIVYLGNIVPSPEQKLPEDLQNYLDSSEHGVVYLSFGSIFDFGMLPEAKRDMFLDVFSELPYNVLLKCKKKLNRIPDNVRVYEWLPQKDVLRHPKIKLFITQGGIHSTDEAISAGVPLLGVPMFSDQWDNAEQYVKFKIGAKVDSSILTKEQLLKNINMVAREPSYATSTKRLRAQFEQNFSPMERAVLTVERVLRGAKHAQLHPRISSESCPELPILTAAALALLIFLFIVTRFVKFMSSMLKKMLQTINEISKYVNDRRTQGGIIFFHK